MLSWIVYSVCRNARYASTTGKGRGTGWSGPVFMPGPGWDSGSSGGGWSSGGDGGGFSGGGGSFGGGGASGGW
jgi:uncharacterized protein